MPLEARNISTPDFSNPSQTRMRIMRTFDSVILPDARTGFHSIKRCCGAALTPLQFGRYNFRLSLPAIFWRESTVAYAIIQAGGKQFRVTEGEVVRIPSLDAEVGSSVEL